MTEQTSLQLAIREPVKIVPHDPTWPHEFDHEKTRLITLFPTAFLAIEHIGSTAIPGLAAKPIIDVMAGVRQITDADTLLPALCENGYTTSAEFNATLPDSRWLMRHRNGHRTHHLHLIIFNSPDWLRRLAFRDLLSSDPTIAHQYETLKHRLAASHPSDREAYGDAKTTFIEQALTQA